MSDRSGSENRQRGTQVGLRLTDEEFQELWKRASAENMSIQDYIRWQLLSDAPMA
jgi:predicted DNA binding CopG/RHH family protein